MGTHHAKVKSYNGVYKGNFDKKNTAKTPKNLSLH